MRKFFYSIQGRPICSLFLFTMLLAAANLSAVKAAVGQPYSAWPCKGFDRGHTGQSPYPAAQTGTLKWSFQTGGPVGSSPAVGPGEVVYIGSDDGCVYAITPDGKQKWKFQTGGAVESSPAVWENGTVYVGSYDGKLYALDLNDGSLKWSYQTSDDIFSSPVVGEDGTIYVGGEDSLVYALDSNGVLIGVAPACGEVYSSPAIRYEYDPNGNPVYPPVVYFGTSGGDIHGYSDFINFEGEFSNNYDSEIYHDYLSGYCQGSLFTCWSGVYSSVAIGADGTLYFGSSDDYIYAFFRDLEVGWLMKWWFRTGGDVDSSPAIGYDGTIYVGSDDGRVYALDSNGNKKWDYQTGGKVWSSPAIGGYYGTVIDGQVYEVYDGTVYIGSLDGKVYAIDANGNLKWSYQTGGGVTSSPAIGFDGTVYIGSSDGKVYAFQGPPPLVLPPDDYSPPVGASINSGSSTGGCFISSLFSRDSGQQKTGAGQVVTREERLWAREVMAQEKSLDTTRAANTLAVLYFQNKTGNQELDALQKGLALMLITDLSKVNRIQVVERIKLQALLDEMDLAGSELAEPDTAHRLGHLLGAQLLVGGDILENQEDFLQLKSNFLDVPASRIIGQPVAEGNLAELLDLEKKLLFEIVKALKVELNPEEEEELRRPLSTNRQAVMALFRAIDASDRGNYEQAARYLNQASKEDPHMSMAQEALGELQNLGYIPSGKDIQPFLQLLKSQTSLTDQLTPESLIKRLWLPNNSLSNGRDYRTVEYPRGEFP